MSDAILIAVLIFVAVTFMRNRGHGPGSQRLRDFFGDRHVPPPHAMIDATSRDQVERLEERVRVLERIITDRKDDLASEIEALREKGARIDKEPIP